MKNLTFALACASTFALFAAIDVPKADFENYTEETGWTVANKDEPGSQFTYWLYEGASGSEDGSTVKAYGGDNLAAPTTGDAAGDKYLELSTEGGTLWRSLAEVKQMENGSATLGDAHTIDPEKGLYIDTMVQFTPTEDGGVPTIDTDNDKLAIWLNVDSSEAGPVTNLCVLGSYISNEGAEAVTNVYKATNKTIDAGTWYRLRVKAIPAIDGCLLVGDGILGFEVSIDNTPIVFDKMTMDAGSLDYVPDADAIRARTVVASALGLNATATLQAVGFKGSGALDNLSISETAPSPAPEEPIPVTPQITLSATEATFSDSLELPTVTVAGNYVLGTDYTVSWSGALPTENPSADVVLTVTVEMCGKYSGNNTATFTVKPAGTPPVVNDWPTDPTTVGGKTAGEAYGFTGDLAGVPADKLARWATGNGTVAFSDAGTIKIEAYLLNVANDDAAIVAGKANFKIPAITVDANGTVTVTSPDPDGSKYNGVITIKGSVTVNGTYDLVKGADDKFPEGARFFKAFLSVK